MEEDKPLNNNKVRPKTYFQLMQKVGSGGKYQFMLMILFSLNWYVTGIILMSTAFLFRNRQFDCQASGLLVTSCSDTICNLPQSQWEKYLDKTTFVSIATQFGQYFCQNQFYLDITSSATYLGAFVGYVLFSFFSDNFGRRTSILVAWTVTTVGSIILATSQNLPMAAIGLFCAGSGSDASINICFYFFGEVVQDQKRQKYSVIIQIAFTLGAIFVTIVFLFVGNWRIVIIATVVIPAIIALFFIVIYVEQTPQFLLRKSKQAALKSLNRIGRINYKLKDLVQIQDIQSVMQQQVQQKQFQKVITPVDLLRFTSLRSITICCCLLSFIIYAMYYGPVLIISQIGFNIFVSNIIIQCSELVSFIPSYFFIQKIPRQQSGIYLFIIATISAGILIFVVKPDDCNACIQSIIELIIVFVFRFCVSFYFCIFQLYFVELYPSRARGLGVGIISAVGTIASTVSPIFLGVLKRNNLNVMIIFTILGILAIGILTLLHETLGLPLKQQIQEIAMQKTKRKTLIRSQIKDKSLISSAQLREKNEINSQNIKSSYSEQK